MGEIKWSEELSLGIESIDAQHKRLIKIANAVIRIARQKMGAKKIINALHYLREYTVYHFRDEENFMASINYPGRPKHAEEHRRLKRQVKMFQDALFHSEDISGDDILAFMREWLIGHVLNTDLDIKLFMEEQAKRESEKRADEENSDMDTETVPLE